MHLPESPQPLTMWRLLGTLCVSNSSNITSGTHAQAQTIIFISGVGVGVCAGGGQEGGEGGRRRGRKVVREVRLLGGWEEVGERRSGHRRRDGINGFRVQAWLV